MKRLLALLALLPLVLPVWAQPTDYKKDALALLARYETLLVESTRTSPEAMFSKGAIVSEEQTKFIMKYQEQGSAPASFEEVARLGQDVKGAALGRSALPRIEANDPQRKQQIAFYETLVKNCRQEISKLKAAVSAGK